jgi:hypothetical protein
MDNKVMNYVTLNTGQVYYTGVNCIPVAYTARAEQSFVITQRARQPRELQTLVLSLVGFLLPW